MAAINTMIYMRGNSRDYDVWESEFGAKDWRWDEETPFLKIVIFVPGLFKGTVWPDWISLRLVSLNRS
jgi:choline dehydrogenase-like flavoprotein